MKVVLNSSFLQQVELAFPNVIVPEVTDDDVKAFLPVMKVRETERERERERFL